MTSFEMSLSGPKLRLFLQLLATCSKMADTFFFEPSSSCLALRAVSDRKSAHFYAEVSASAFESYKCSHVAEGNTSTLSSLNVQVLSRSVASSVLRLCPTLVRLAVRLDSNADEILFTLFCQTGCTKSFYLGVGEQTVSEKADVAAVEQVTQFRTVAEPRMWLNTLNVFSSSVKTIRLTMTAHRLGVGEGDANQEDSTTAVTSAVVSVDPRNFLSYTLGTSTHSSPPHHNGSAVCLPMKCVEVKPIRWFVLIVELLSMNLRLSSGGAGVPILLEALPRANGDNTPFVRHLSLLVAATDKAASSQAASGVPSQGANRSGAPGGLDRSGSRLARMSTNADPIASVAPSSKSMGELVTNIDGSEFLLAGASGFAPQEHETLAPPSAAVRGLPEGRSSMTSMIGPSFADMTPVNQQIERKRGRDDLLGDSLAGSAASRTSFVAGSTARRSASADGVAPSFTASGEAVPRDPLFSVFPLDFEALMANDDDDDPNGDEDYAIEQFLISRCAPVSAESNLCSHPLAPQGAQSTPSSSHVSTSNPVDGSSSEVIDFASALLMVHPTQC